MKVKLEFDTERNGKEYLAAIHGMHMALSADAFKQRLKSLIKHGDHSDEVSDALDNLWADFNDCFDTALLMELID